MIRVSHQFSHQLSLSFPFHFSPPASSRTDSRINTRINARVESRINPLVHFRLNSRTDTRSEGGHHLNTPHCEPHSRHVDGVRRLRASPTCYYGTAVTLHFHSPRSPDWDLWGGKLPQDWSRLRTLTPCSLHIYMLSRLDHQGI